MRGLMVFAVLTLACTVDGCRSGGTDTARGKKPEHYLTSNGDLVQQLEIRESNTIGGGSTERYIVIEKDGRWKTGAKYDGSHIKRSPDGLPVNLAKENTGTFSKAEIAELAKILAENDMANLSSGTLINALDPRGIDIRFGEHRKGIDERDGNWRLRNRFHAIAGGVKQVIEKNDSKK